MVITACVAAKGSVHACAQVKAMLGQIEQRHSEMRELEIAMLDLYQVFLDMSVVVAEQGETLDRIESWVCPPYDVIAFLVRRCTAWGHRLGSTASPLVDKAGSKVITAKLSMFAWR